MDHHSNNDMGHPNNSMVNPNNNNNNNNNNGVSYDLTHYRVYHAVYTLPGGGGVRNLIYVNKTATSDFTDQTGHLFQVMGIRSTGPMVFKHRGCRHPFCSPEGRSMRHIGWALQGDCVERIRYVCAGVPPPPQVLPGSEPLGSCKEWTEEVIKALRDAGVLEQLRSTDEKDTIYRHM